LRAHYAVSQVKTFNDLEVYLFTEPDDEASEFKCEVD
jgi:hypothetical protein